MLSDSVQDTAVDDIVYILHYLKFLIMGNAVIYIINRPGNRPLPHLLQLSESIICISGGAGILGLTAVGQCQRHAFDINEFAASTQLYQ